MQNALIILQQVAVMVLIALIGYLLVRGRKLDPLCTVSLSNILLYAVTPGVIISAMQREYDAAEAGALLTALLLAVGTHLIFILLARLLIRERSGNQNTGVERFALVMSNSSYIGIPMVQAVLGEDGVFFLTAYLVAFNLCLYSYGRLMMIADSARRGLPGEPGCKSSLRQCLVNPATVSVAIGGALYFLHIELPEVLLTVAQGFRGLNTVLSMLLVGIFISQADLRQVFCSVRGIVLALLRLVALPLVLMLLLAALDLSRFVPDGYLIKTTIVIAACAPTAVAASFMGELYGGDSIYAVRLIVLSTLMSVATMPLLLLIWEWLVRLAGQ
ncbi:AEC family transporter [Harryflintia acetispora]|uniref:AEC family transporter n=1 Tax=Harryflintia acetispora TaxID=1849041 RepID=UPI00189B0E68